MLGAHRLQGRLHFCALRQCFCPIELAQNGIAFVGTNLRIMFDNLRGVAHRPPHQDCYLAQRQICVQQSCRSRTARIGQSFFPTINPVRRQSFWNQWRFKLRESLAHLVCVIMRRVCCDASVALRMSSV